MFSVFKKVNMFATIKFQLNVRLEEGNDTISLFFADIDIQSLWFTFTNISHNSIPVFTKTDSIIYATNHSIDDTAIEEDTI